MKKITAFSAALTVCLSLASHALADSLWDHNGSVMRLVHDGDQRRIFYEDPRSILRGAGVQEGTLLFDGYRSGNKYSGTARRFSKYCTSPLPYNVSGSVVGEKKIVLRGRREVYDEGCRRTGRFTQDSLVFTFLRAAPPLPRSQVPGRRAPKKQYTTAGSGFSVSDDGFVLTNRHVVEECQRVTVDDRGSAVVKALDNINDLALLKFDGKTRAMPFRSTSPGLGQSVFALGFPYAGVLGAGVKFTDGVISSLSGPENDTRYLQVTAPVQPGNSGGPLVDAEGLVVGVVTARIEDVAGSPAQNVNFAIRGNLAEAFLTANGVKPVVVQSKSPLSSSEIASRAQAYTVQIICH